MDKFPEMIQMMSKMTEKQRRKTIKENEALCICPVCPTYNECAQKESESLYCISGGSSTCVTKESGCICPACPITEKIHLTNQYFCTRGTEEEQRDAE